MKAESNSFVSDDTVGGQEQSTDIRIWHISAGEKQRLTAHDHKVLFITAGKLSIHVDEYEEFGLSAKNMVFVPIGVNIILTASEDSTILILKMGAFANSIGYSLQSQRATVASLPMQAETPDTGLPILQFTPVITAYVAGLKTSVRLGLKGTSYFSMKIKELLYLIDTAYSKEDNRRFWAPLATNDRIFSDFIYSNYRKASSIQNLADICCYSLSGFEKRFKRVFGVSASKWMRKQKAVSVYAEICKGHKTFKEISFEYGFCSPAHFNDFCKAQLGDSPGNIRRKAQQKRQGQ